MYRGTTPLLILNLNTALTWAEVGYLEVTLKDDTSHAVKLDRSKFTYDSTNKRLVAQLTQANTLGLSGKCRLQLRYQLTNGLTYASNRATIQLDSILDNTVLGKEEINTGAGNFDSVSADLIADTSDEAVAVAVEAGTPVVLPSNIKYIAVNGEDQTPSSAGRISLTIPLEVSDLEDGTELLSDVSNLKTRATALETTTTSQGQLISAVSQSLITEKGKTEALQADVTTLKNQQKATASDVTVLQRKVTTQQADIDLAKGNSQAAVTWSREAQATATAAQTAAQTAQNTADNTAAVVDTMPKQFKTINGQNITGEGNIEIEAGGGTVQSVSVNGGTPAEPDESGNINLTIEEGGAKEIADLTDGDRVSTLETQMQGKANTSDLANYATTTQLAAKANQSDLNTTNGNVSTLQTKVGQLEQQTSKIGDLNNLTTTNKNNIVGAVNEVKASIVSSTGITTPSGDPLHYVYVDCGATYNSSTDRWTIGSFSDYTTTEIRQAYSLRLPQAFYNVNGLYNGYPYKCMFPINIYGPGLAFSSCAVMFYAARCREILFIKNNTTANSMNLNGDITNTFRSCPNLETIKSLYYQPTKGMTTAFEGDSKLKYINFTLCNSSLYLVDSPLLELRTIASALKVAGANTFTITLHNSVYNNIYINGDPLQGFTPEAISLGIDTYLASKTNVTLASA